MIAIFIIFIIATIGLLIYFMVGGVFEALQPKIEIHVNTDKKEL